ncbi:Calcium-binding protein [Venturia nashicola]|nr:Calcium-binding protein [Venturia nashicola]
MIAYSALPLLLTLASLSTRSFAKRHTFPSAKLYNICGKLNDGGSGFGRVIFRTISAYCVDDQRMAMKCRWSNHANPLDLPAIYDCQKPDQCVNVAKALGTENPDAGCQNPPQLSGVKGAADIDNHACSSGINTGDASIVLLSSITPDDPAVKLDGCSIIQSGTQNKLFSHSPCEKSSTIITLKAKTTYQACIDTAATLAGISIGFHWHLHSTGKLRGRGLDDGRPLSEMLTIDESTSNPAFPIVIHDD